MKVLVTGATGNVGRYVVEELKQQGEAVRAAGTDLKKLRQLFGEDVEAVRFDFLDPSTYPDALDSVDRVFLMRPPHLGKPRDLYPFIDAMAQRQIKLVTFLSLMGVENNTIPPHHKIEKYIEAAGIPYAHIRPGFFMQNISGIHAREIIKDNQVLCPQATAKPVLLTLLTSLPRRPCCCITLNGTGTPPTPSPALKRWIIIRWRAS